MLGVVAWCCAFSDGCGLFFGWFVARLPGVFVPAGIFSALLTGVL